jgi:exodeoxyribonuclease VII small subunit
MKSEEKKIDDLSFEKAVSRLEDIVSEMESGRSDLDAMVKLFEEGQRLVKLCTGKLSAIERKVEILTKGESGKVTATPFEE